MNIAEDYVLNTGIFRLHLSKSVGGTWTEIANSGNTLGPFPIGTIGQMDLQFSGATIICRWNGSVLIQVSDTAINGIGKAGVSALRDINPGDANRASATEGLHLDRFTVTETRPNTSPALTLVSTLTGATEDTPFVISFAALQAAANESDLEGQSISFRVESITSGTLGVRAAGSTGAATAVVPGTTMLDATKEWVWTPAANAFGTIPALTIKAYDGFLASATAVSVSVQVAAVNDAPTITAIPAQVIWLNGVASPVAFTVGDLETAAGSLTVIGSSSNTNLIDTAGLNVAGTTGARTLTMTPKVGQSGAATITVTVTDNGAPARSASTTFALTVAAPGSAFVTDNFTGGAAGQDITARTGEVGATWTKNVPAGAGSVAISGTGSVYGTGSAVLVASGQPASADYTVSARIMNLGGTASTIGVCGRFSVNVFQGYILRVVGASSRLELWQMINGVATQLGSSTAAIVLPAVGSSKLLELQMNGSTIIGRYDGITYFNLTNTAITAIGQAGVRVTTASTATTGLHLDNLLATNATSRIPTITAIPNQTVNEDVATGALSFSISDTETAPGSLVVSASSSNSALVSAAGLALSGSGGSRTLVVTPLANQSGTSTISISVSDGDTPPQMVTRSFLLTVNAVNDAPTITTIGPQSVLAGESTIALPFTVGDVETAVGGLMVTTSSSNTGLIDNTGLILGGTTAARTLKMTPKAGQTGSATITVTVTDTNTPSASTSTTCLLTVNGTTIVSDTFTGGTSGQDLTTRTGEVGATWAKNTAGGTGSVALSSAGSAFGTGSSVLLASGVPPSPDYTVSAQILNLGGTMTTMGVCGRYSPTLMTGYILRVVGASSRVELYQMVNNVAIQLGSTTASITLPAVGSSKLLELQMVGSTIIGRYDGTTYFNLSNTAVTATGQAGIRSATTGTATTGLHMDALTATAATRQTPTVTTIPNQTINEEGATGTLGFTTSANARTYTATSSNTTLVASAGLALSGSGTARTVKVTPQPDQNGTTTITVTVSDAGVPPLSVTTSFTLTVAPVNDRPSFVAGSGVTAIDTAGAQTVAGWATSPVTGPSDESSQTVSYLCSGFDASLFSVAPAISPAGTLTFTPATGAFGTTTVSVRLRDSGGTANGGVDTSVAQALTISIQDSAWASLPAQTIFVLASESVYPTETSNINEPTRKATSYAYQWYPGTNQIAAKSTTLPIVTAAENGPDDETIVAETYDISGRPVWIRDGDGYISYRAYDAFTGAVTVSIADVDTAKTDADVTTPPPFTTPTATPIAGGTHLKTLAQVDLLGRSVRTTDPKGSVTYTVYNDAAHEVRVYPGWDSITNAPTGPTMVVRENWAGNFRETLTSSTLPLPRSGPPNGTEAVDAGLESLRRELLDDNGRVAFVDTYVDLAGWSPTNLGSQRVYVDPPAVATGAFEREAFTYLTRGFPDRRTRADGTIERQVTDFLGRVTQVWRGTNTADPAKFKQISETIYGGGADLSQPSVTRTIGDNDAGTGQVLYTTSYRYDGRGRLNATLGPDGVLTTLTLDNLSRPTLSRTWAGIGTMPAGDPAGTALRSEVSTSYDALSQAWQSGVTEVQGADGTTPGERGATLVTKQWFDRRGGLIKRQVGTAGAFSKIRRDGIGRTVYAWTGMDTAETTAWTSARTSTSDTIAEATLAHYDLASNAVATTRFVRRENDTTTVGDLGASNSQLSVQVNWYDLAHRPIGSADYGRDNGSTRYVWSTTGTLIATGSLPTEAVNVPRTPNTANDDYRVSRMAYSPAGRPFQTTDNLGRISETSYDAAGRALTTIANKVDGMVAAGETETNQLTTFVYAVGGGLAEQWSSVANGTAVTIQKTRYLRTSTLDRSWVTAVILPDSTDTTTAGTDQVQTTFDRIGRLRTRTDQRGVLRTFTYDSAGRLANDVATTVPVGVDASVRRLVTVYDDLSRVRSRSSWNTTSGGTVPLDEVRRTYDSWGNINATAQAHAGAAVVGSSPTVSYTWDDGGPASGPGSARSLRPTGVTYPSTGHGVAYRYPTSGLGMALNRPEAITSAGTDIMTAEYLGVGTLARQTMSRAGLINMQRSAGGNASGYNRYWQVATHAWTVGSTQVDGWNFLYDRGGRQTARLATWSTTRASRDDVVTYDGLDRVTAMRRGQASTTGVLAASATWRDWSWTLDQAGNWRSYVQDTDGAANAAAAPTTQTRVHNLANEIDTTDSHSDAVGDSIASISGSSNWIDPIYNAAGAMTKMPAVGTEVSSRTLTWDAWGRLVAAKDGTLATIWTARYDAEHRLIQSTDVAAAKISDFYVDESGHEVEVRVNNLLAEVYVWGGGDQLLRIGTGPAGSITTYYAVLSDQQGSVTALVADGTSTVVERYRYDAYGGRTIYAADGTTVRATSSYGMRYAYTGRPFDTVTGLGYYRYRWYHASLGRFISRDPAGYIDGGNLYQYVRGNPLWFIDPWGLGATDESVAWYDRVLDAVFPQLRERPRNRLAAGMLAGGPENAARLANQLNYIAAGAGAAPLVGFAAPYVAAAGGGLSTASTTAQVWVANNGATALMATSLAIDTAVVGGVVLDGLDSLERSIPDGDTQYAQASMLPGEGLSGPFGDLIAAGVKGDNITPHHIPSANRMSALGIDRDAALAINMEHPCPGSGGRHRQTFTYGTQADAGMTPRQALGAGVQDLRRIYQQDGLYTSAFRAQLRSFIQLSKSTFPGIFRKP